MHVQLLDYINEIFSFYNENKKNTSNLSTFFKILFAIQNMYIYIISRNVLKDVLYLSILILMYVHILAKINEKKIFDDNFA